MIVQQIMTKTPKCCSPGMNVAETTASLWAAGCGALPVVNAEEESWGSLQIAISASHLGRETGGLRS